MSPINIGDSLLLDVIDTVMKSLLLLSRMPIGFLFEVFFLFSQRLNYREFRIIRSMLVILISDHKHSNVLS